MKATEINVKVTYEELTDWGFEFAETPVFENDEVFVIQTCGGGFTIFQLSTSDEIFAPDQIDNDDLMAHLVEDGYIVDGGIK